MSTFAETANVEFIICLPRKTNFCFPFAKKTNGGLLFLFAVCSKQMEVAIFS
jgi:hypothetical protein